MTTEEGGFTLVEMLVSVVVLSLVLGAAVSAVVGIQRSVGEQAERRRTRQSMAATVELLTTALRQAGSDPFGAVSTPLDPDPDGDGDFDDVRVVSDFNPPDGDVEDVLEDIRVWVGGDTLRGRWQSGESPQAMVAPVTSLAFEYFAADGTQLTSAAGATWAPIVRATVVTPGVAGGTPDTVRFTVHRRN